MNTTVCTTDRQDDHYHRTDEVNEATGSERIGKNKGKGDKKNERQFTDVLNGGANPSPTQESIAPAQAGKPAKIPPEMMKKVVETVRIAQSNDGGSEVRLGLKATVFEGMNLKVASKDGIVTVTFEVEQMAAQSALKESLEDLRTRLVNQGLNVAEINVNLKDSGTGGETGGEHGRDEDDGDGSTHSPIRPPRRTSGRMSPRSTGPTAGTSSTSYQI